MIVWFLQGQVQVWIGHHCGADFCVFNLALFINWIMNLFAWITMIHLHLIPLFFLSVPFLLEAARLSTWCICSWTSLLISVGRRSPRHCGSPTARSVESKQHRKKVSKIMGTIFDTHGKTLSRLFLAGWEFPTLYLIANHKSRLHPTAH